MKRIIIVLALLLFSLSASAERENYIILFDCTASMGGSEGGPNVWEDAKDILTQSILNVNGEDARIIVIPFQDKIGTIFDFPASDKSVINQVMSEVDRMKSSRHRGTSICKAWDVGLKYLEDDCLNFMFLLTDGADNIVLGTGNPVALKADGTPKTDVDRELLDECTEEVCKRIRRWCDFGPNKIAFYSRLTQNARVEKITEAASGCDNIRFSDGLNIAQLKTREVTFNILEFLSADAIKIPLKLTNTLSGKASIKSESDLFNLTLASGGFINGSATLIVTPNKDYDELRSSVGNSLKIKARVDSEDLDNLNIFLNEVTLNVIGSPETVMNVTVHSDVLGKVRHYRKFLWKKASVPDTLYTDISFELNDYAESADSKVGFNISSTAGNQCEFFVNGEKCSSFKVDSDSEIRIGTVFKPEAQEGVHVIEIASSGRGVDRIDNARLDKGETWNTQLSAIYKLRSNPLLTALIIIALILAASFILWMCLFRYMVFPRFRCSIISVGKGDEVPIPRRARGFIKCVITSSSKRQSGLVSFLSGPVLYFPMSITDGVTEDIVIEPLDKKSVRICKDRTGTYLISMARLKITTVGQPSAVSEVINQQTRKTIKINIQ